MTERILHPGVDALLGKLKAWRDETEQLRAICLDCGLVEAVKWGAPCYTFQDQNVVLIHGFKAYCALLFFKGALLPDEAGLLVQQTANVQAARQLRFTSVAEIAKLRPVIKRYIAEAVKVEQSGQKVAFKPTEAFAMPEEFAAKLDAMPDLKVAFEALTPGRQRAYLLHFSKAKQSSTRLARVEKSIPAILEGKGLDD